MLKLDAKIDSFIKSLHQGVPPHNPDFANIIDESYTSLEKYYQHMYIQIRDVYPEQAGNDDYYREFRQTILWNSSGWLNFAIFSTAYKIKVLLDDVVSGLNENHPFRASMSARAIIEYCVTLRDFKRNIDKHIYDMSEKANIIQTSGENDPNWHQAIISYDQAILDIVNLGLEFSRATRFNWSSLFQEDALKFDNAWDDMTDQISQKNVMTLLEKYPETKTRKIDNELLKYYALLCEYTHPNIGSHHLITDSITRVHSTTIMYTFNPSPEGKIPLIHAIRAIASPLTLCLPNLFTELENLRNIEQMFLGMFNQMLEDDSMQDA